MTAGATASMTTEWLDCLVPRAEMAPDLAKELRAMIGRGPALVSYLAHAPWLARTAARVINGGPAYLPSRLAERIGLVVAQDNSCRYCYGMQRSFLRIEGRSEAEVDRIVRDSMVVDLSPAERAAVDYARRLSRCSPRPGRTDFERVVAAGVDPRVAVELVVHVTEGSFMNRVATLTALPTEPVETLTKTSYFRFIRPVLARGMRRPAARPLPPPQPNDGPCAAVVTALGDSPWAHVIRATLDDAFASPILPLRTKALIIAVVARALDCPWGEREARALLAREGFAAADVDEVLQTLSSPRLDAREARVVPFARETVRYQTAAIQVRMREVARELSPAETMELIGVLSLANGLCRLSVLVDAR
jgi:AhpD family alkylhydroperoxidase